ncbi:MAG: cytochrome c3 family protein [Pseudomonadota bacterium]|nr:cytochrome c3 family protein [Pseudomonadota bacterium]
MLLAVAVIGAFALLVTIAHYRSRNTDAVHIVPYHEGTMLAVTFAHADHTEQSCIACHHNFVDNTGAGMCFDCHKTDPTIKDLIEDQFHDLCRDCHIDQQRDGKAHGPTRQCIDCHTPDEDP